MKGDKKCMNLLVTSFLQDFFSALSSILFLAKHLILNIPKRFFTMKCLSVKKISFISLLAIVLSSFGVFCLCRPASAWNFGTVSAASVRYSSDGLPGTQSYARYTDQVGGTTFYNVSSDLSSGRVVFRHNPVNGQPGYVRDLTITTGTQIPKNALLRVNFILEGNSNTIIDVNPFRSSDIILQQNCETTAWVTSNNIDRASKLYCSVLLLKSQAEYSISFTGNLMGFESAGFKIFTPQVLNYITITNDSGGGDVDISQIETDITNILTQAQNANLLLSDIKTLLNQVKTQGQAQQETIENAVQNALDDEKDQYEDQAEENAATINSDSSAAQGTATSLLGVVGQFISTLTSAQPTNCNLNGNLIPHLPLGNLDLCQNSPPAAITVLGSLVLIAFVVPLAYHTVKRMLALIGSFQS